MIVTLPSLDYYLSRALIINNSSQQPASSTIYEYSSKEPHCCLLHATMSELEERLRGAPPIIEKILSISGSAGASIGILHNGKSHIPTILDFETTLKSNLQTLSVAMNVKRLTRLFGRKWAG